MRPRLKPAARRTWRSQTSLQFWRDPDRALILTGVEPAVLAALDAMDGTRTTEEWLAFARVRGLGDEEAERLLRLLEGSGLLEDAGVRPIERARLPLAELDRLAPELSALSVTQPAPAAAAARRRAASVRVLGAGRLGATLAAVLAAAGVGTLCVEDDRPVGEADVAPFAHRPGDVGRGRGDALRQRLGADYPALRFADGRQAALTILADPAPPDPAPALIRRGRAHLHVGLRDAAVVVGPLVVPGRSACAGCLNLVRAGRDPGWPLVAAAPPADCAAAVPVTLAAALGAREALAFLEGGEPACSGGTVEVAASGWQVRRRSWPAHPRCPCGAGMRH